MVSGMSENRTICSAVLIHFNLIRNRPVTACKDEIRVGKGAKRQTITVQRLVKARRRTNEWRGRSEEVKLGLKMVVGGGDM